MTPAPETPPEESGPDAIRKNFLAVANATDTPAPGDGSRLPTVNLSQPISALARTVGMILRPAPIFRFGESLSTVDESGRIAGMTAERFTSWVENWLAFIRSVKIAPGTYESKAESIGKDLAGKIMAADQFRDQLRELKAVAEVRLPVWTGEGEARRIELAPEGFDEGTGLFTVNRIPYRDDMTENEGSAFLWDCLKEFPFHPEGQPSVAHRRSFTAQMAAMLGVFCRELFPEGTPRLAVVHGANQPGSGKSLLTRLTLCPVHGMVGECDKSDDEKSFQTLLETTALQRDPFLVLDNCYHIRSKALDRFISANVHKMRLYHSQKSSSVSNVTQVFMNGNNLTFTPDIERRSLAIDLLEPGEVASRRFKFEITEDWLALPETRAKFLAALWALVRHWRDEGMPMMREHCRPSFVRWTQLIGGIVMACGMTNPFVPRVIDSGGDETGRALMLVIGRLAGEFPPERPEIIKPADIIARAETDDLLELIVKPDKDPKRSLGWAITALGLPRHLIDSQGRAFEFKRRELASGAGYVVTFL